MWRMVVSGGQGMGGRGQGMGGRGRSYPVISEVLAAAAEHRFEPVDGEGGAHAHIEAVAKPVHGQVHPSLASREHLARHPGGLGAW